MPDAELERRIEEGSLYPGKFRINKANRSEAYVTCSKGNLPDDVFIPGSRSQNRAFDGDEVVVELLTGAELEKEVQRQINLKKQKAQDSHDRQKAVEVSDIGNLDFGHFLVSFCRTF